MDFKTRLVSRALKSLITSEHSIDNTIIEMDDQVLKKYQKACFPFIHHPFEVKCSSSKHNIDVVANNTFVKVSSQSMVCF